MPSRSIFTPLSSKFDRLRVVIREFLARVNQEVNVARPHVVANAQRKIDVQRVVRVVADGVKDGLSRAVSDQFDLTFRASVVYYNR